MKEQARSKQRIGAEPIPDSVALLAPDRTYRRVDVHERFGGQRQGGISTPSGRPFVFLFTSEAGKQHGYFDGWSEGGVFLYTGEGQEGDMEFTGGNRAIRDHAEYGKDLHLFEYVAKGLVRYIGQMICAGCQFKDIPDRTGKTRKGIVFRLLPFADFIHDDATLKAIGEGTKEEDFITATASLPELRRLALASAAPERPPKEQKALTRMRSRAIKLYVLKRSMGKCEACGSPAPFVTPQKTPYLEPHHIRRLSDGGPDHPRWVIAACPNCHRKAHYADDAKVFNEGLAEKVATLEGAL